MFEVHSNLKGHTFVSTFDYYNNFFLNKKNGKESPKQIVRFRAILFAVKANDKRK